MKIFDYSIKSSEEILSEFSSHEQKGLSGEEAEKRFLEFGPNSLVLSELSAWRILGRQFRSAFVYLLIAAMAVTMFLSEYVDAAMIFIFLAVNTTLGFLQEYRSEKTVKLLNKYVLPRTKVLRDGKIELLVSERLVPGDIIILETGDKIPADVRIIRENNIVINETILTGESIPVFKKAESLESVPSAYHEALNLGFFGTDVLRGKAVAIVLATGRDSAFGQLAELMVETRKISDFEKGIARFSGFIIKLVVFTLLIVFAANIFIKGAKLDILELVIFSVALTVSVIPEALPLVTTFSLARGAKRLSEKKVVVKRLSAIEDLGGIEILCSDKTGTLTENELTVAGIFSDNQAEALFLANAASDFDLEEKSEPFDIALEKKLSNFERLRIKNLEKIAETPFDPRIRRNVVLVKNGASYLLITRGAPEAVLAVCQGIGSLQSDRIKAWTAKEGKEGKRALAVGYKKIDQISQGGDFDDILQSADFKFSGVVAFVDPIKPSALAAVEKAKALGVKIVVITGDSLEVAGAVGCRIGLIDSSEKVLGGQDWEALDQKRQKEALDGYSVFARVSPEQKFKIIEMMRERHMVGFLGEGINDAPALKIAGVSLVVDSASDIAREAADIVLLQKNLEVILDGVEEGRQVFANTTKYIKSTLASNFGNFFAVATASLMIDFLPMLPIQILLVNLLSDTPMISISTDSVDRDELVSPKKYEVKDVIIIAIVLGVVSTVFDFIYFAMFYRLAPAVLQTNWFIGSILTEIALIFSVRTKALFCRGARPSWSMIWLSLSVFALTIILPYTRLGHDLFRFAPPSRVHLASILGLVAVYFACSETVKLFYYKNKMSK